MSFSSSHGMRACRWHVLVDNMNVLQLKLSYTYIVPSQVNIIVDSIVLLSIPCLTKRPL